MCLALSSWIWNLVLWTLFALDPLDRFSDLIILCLVSRDCEAKRDSHLLYLFDIFDLTASIIINIYWDTGAVSIQVVGHLV